MQDVDIVVREIFAKPLFTLSEGMVCGLRYSYKNYQRMLSESISVYDEDLKPIILKFLKSPKANFMASPDLVRYFHIEDYEDESSYIEDLEIKDQFTYRKQIYIIEEKRKKNYLCTQLKTDKKYIFKPLARVEKIN